MLIMAEWNNYRKLNWEVLAVRIRKLAWVFDTRAFTEPAQVRSEGLNLWQVGDGMS